MTKPVFFSFAFAMLTTAVQAQYVSEVWNPDNGDGTYTNPIINADYSDPDVCVGASGEDYYMTASSFQCTPGLPILHSKDLVNWEIINYAIPSRLYEGDDELVEHFNTPRHGDGVWAPSIRYHNGEYYIYWGDPDFGVFMVKTKDPAGKWSNPLCVIKGKGYIDTTPLWDDDGRCYLVNGWANSRARFASVLTVREMSADGTRPIGQPVIVFDGNGTENRTCEGPKFYKRDGWYWIMCPAGGVPTGFQLAMRSKSPYGPYESMKVLAQGSTNINGPHQGGWVHTKFGEDWFIHFQDKEAYGRVCHLQPVTWKDNWPVMGKVPAKGYCGEPVITYQKPKTSATVKNTNPMESDEFNTPTVGKQWQWHGNYNEKFGVPTPWGVFRIYCYKAGSPDNLGPAVEPVTLGEGTARIWDVPNLMLQKTPADSFVATAKLRFTSKEDNQYGGIIMMGLDYSTLVVKRVGKEFLLQSITCQQADKGKPETAEIIATLKPTAEDKIDYQPAIHCDIYMKMKVKAGKVTFAYSMDGKKYKDAGKEFTMKEGKWIGAKVGFVAVQPAGKENRGWIDADWFRVTAK
ncbi:MAG: glycoside hydrolase 43 family protein [Prevotella sp.]|nr:glycoside hydrolase 43 family protein [Prevotella sp.]